jgi:hypothetical protein
MQVMWPSCSSVRRKPKHEQVATAKGRRRLGLSFLFARIRFEKVIRPGMAHVVEPLYPFDDFAVAVVQEQSTESGPVSRGRSAAPSWQKISDHADAVMEESRTCFGVDDLIIVQNHLQPGGQLRISFCAFAGMNAVVLKCHPAKKRVQILLGLMG